MTRRLDARGKGEFSYDYVHDVLIFRIKDRDYKFTVEFQNLAIDIDTEDFVTGIRILDASKACGIDKMAFRNIIQGEFSASVVNNVISIRLKFAGKHRNKLAPTENFTFSAQNSASHPISDSIVEAREITMAI